MNQKITRTMLENQLRIIVKVLKRPNIFIGKQTFPGEKTLYRLEELDPAQGGESHLSPAMRIHEFWRYLTGICDALAISGAEDLRKALADLLRRITVGARIKGNPYTVAEVLAGLKVLAELQGETDAYEALARELESDKKPS